MMRRERNILLLMCLLTIVWIAAGYAGTDRQSLEMSHDGAPVSSMNTEPTRADFLETGNLTHFISSSADWFRSQQLKPGLFTVTIISTIMLIGVILYIKLFTADNFLFDFFGVISYIHDKDGMK